MNDMIRKCVAVGVWNSTTRWATQKLYPLYPNISMYSTEAAARREVEHTLDQLPPSARREGK